MATKEVQQIQLTVVKDFTSGKTSVQGRGNFRAVEFDTTDNQFVELTEADVASVLSDLVLKVEAKMAEGGFSVTEATPPSLEEGGGE
jgi:hypothetical protein